MYINRRKNSKSQILSIIQSKESIENSNMQNTIKSFIGKRYDKIYKTWEQGKTE